MSGRPRQFIARAHPIRLRTVTGRLVQEQVAARLAPLNISYAQAVGRMLEDLRHHRTTGG